MSPKERLIAKPLIPILLIVAIILLILGIWYQHSSHAPAPVAPKPALVVAPVAATASTVPETAAPASSAVASTATTPAASAPATSTTTTTTVTAGASSPAVTAAALPKDRATAEEELDRLNDEYARLKAQKASLTKQLEVQNKIVALKDQQIKQLESSAP